IDVDSINLEGLAEKHLKKKQDQSYDVVLGDILDDLIDNLEKVKKGNEIVDTPDQVVDEPEVPEPSGGEQTESEEMAPSFLIEDPTRRQIDAFLDVLEQNLDSKENIEVLAGRSSIEEVDEKDDFRLKILKILIEADESIFELEQTLKEDGAFVEDDFVDMSIKTRDDDGNVQGKAIWRVLDKIDSPKKYDEPTEGSKDESDTREDKTRELTDFKLDRLDNLLSKMSRNNESLECIIEKDGSSTTKEASASRSFVIGVLDVLLDKNPGLFEFDSTHDYIAVSIDVEDSEGQNDSITWKTNIVDYPEGYDEVPAKVLDDLMEYRETGRLPDDEYVKQLLYDNKPAARDLAPDDVSLSQINAFLAQEGFSENFYGSKEDVYEWNRRHFSE
ncbi:MAG: hypothetical protein ABEJ02_02450, partial [Candidatus Paceibacteria bacterium]